MKSSGPALKDRAGKHLLTCSGKVLSKSGHDILDYRKLGCRRNNFFHPISHKLFFSCETLQLEEEGEERECEQLRHQLLMILDDELEKAGKA